MTREEQIEDTINENWSSLIENEDPEIAFRNGIKWADSHPIISKERLEELIKGIESGRTTTLSQYSRNPELLKAFDDGQISALKLLVEWIDYHIIDGKTNKTGRSSIPVQH